MNTMNLKLRLFSWMLLLCSILLPLWVVRLIEAHIIANKYLYERKVRAFICQIKGELFIDIGANLGHYSLLLCKNFRNIIAFEPDPEIMQLFRQNASLLKARNIMYIPMIVYDTDGTTSFYQAPTTEGYGLHVPSGHGRQYHVKTCSLGSFLGNETRTIDLVKVDVEGAEWKVLQGAIPIMNKVRRWVIELHNSDRKQELEDILTPYYRHLTWLDFNHLYACDCR